MREWIILCHHRFFENVTFRGFIHAFILPCPGPSVPGAGFVWEAQGVWPSTPCSPFWVNPNLSNNKNALFLPRWKSEARISWDRHFHPRVHCRKVQINSLQWIKPALWEAGHLPSLCIHYLKSVEGHPWTASMRSFLVHHPWRCLPTSSGKKHKGQKALKRRK